MNERIKELANQMFSMEQFEYAEEFINDEFMEKFAELIVKKCAGIIESQDVDPAFKLRMSWAVKEHFGVEE